MGGGASKGAAPAAGGASKAICADMPAEPEFKALDLNAEIDGLFTTVQGLFSDLTKLNVELNVGIKKVMEDKVLLALEQKNKDATKADAKTARFPAVPDGNETGNLTAMVRNAVIGARDAFDPALPPAVVTKVRAKVAKNDIKGADKEASAETMKIKEKVLPKVDHSKAKEGIIEVCLPPDFKMEAVSGSAKPPMDVVLALFEIVRLVGNTKIKEMKTRIEAVLKEIKEKASPSKLSEVAKEKTKDMGMGDKFKYMKEKGAEMGANGKASAVLKDFMMILSEKVKALGEIFIKAWSDAILYGFKYEKDAAFVDGCPAAPDFKVYFPASYAPPTLAAIAGAPAKK